MSDSLTQRFFAHQILALNSLSAFLRYKITMFFFLQAGCDAGRLIFQHYEFGKTVGIQCLGGLFLDGIDLSDPEALTWSAKWKVTDGKVSL